MRDALDAATATALRMDDVGACSKRYEVYSNWRCGNWLFLKYLPPFKAWGPYRELEAGELEALLGLLERRGARLTVAVTASWVEDASRRIPFPKAFPAQARVLREGVERGLLEVANHGLTHCVVRGNAFKPRAFGSNRSAHREFLDGVPAREQEEHLREAQEILQGWLGREVVTFVPPGNAFGEATLEAAARQGLRFVSCDTESRLAHGLAIVGGGDVLAFHDRELVQQGLAWLEPRLPARGCTVRERGEAMLS
jgi:hypothetical protein